MVQGSQMTVSWYVDDLKISHTNPIIVDQFLHWVKETYGKIGVIKTMRGKIHEYLGMKLDYSVKGQVIIDMVDYVESMINSFPSEYLSKT
jgi:hypothetical protein